MPRGVPRPDVTVEEVARRWLAGESILSIASHFQMDTGPINSRLKKARLLFPDLPWDEPRQVRKISPTAEYVEMKDGVPRKRDVAGSFIRT